MSTHDRKQKPDEVDEPDDAAPIKELTEDELDDVAGGSSAAASTHYGTGL
jgi:hypothetical protein